LGQSIVQISNIEVELTAGKAFPDLILALWNKPNSSIKWISPYPALSNTITTISALIKNVGIVPVDKSFDTDLYIDGMHKKTWRFNPVSEGEDIHHANNPLIPGKSFPISYSDTFSPGNHSFKWVVDSKNEVKESDESQQSNTLEATVNFLTESDLPDLIVDDIFPQEDLVFGQNITWKVRIKNIGKNAVNIPFSISLKNADGVQFGAFWRDYLGAGNAATFSTKQFASFAGTEKLTATVDVGNVVMEKDETNNMLTKNFTINKVDLEVKDLDLKPKNPDVSQDLIITFTIKNNGPGDITKPFKIKVYPGAVNSGVTQPTEIEFPTNKLPLKSTNSATMQYKFTPSYPGKYNVVVTADSTFVYKEENTQNNTATATIQLAGMINGRVVDPDPNYPSVTIDKLEWYINKDPTISWFRKKVAYQALYEAKVGLCGQDAKDRYGASGKWCSEFASWLYLKVGMKNIKYCSAYFLFCWNNVHLDEVTLNSELVKLFDRNGNRFKWRTRNQVTPQTAEVGDYLSLKTNGKKKNHAAIIIAVSQDNNYLWTVEGNCGDCVKLQRKNYFKDGSINENIDGIGKIDAGLF
jgi:hypothetical protein